MKYGIHTLDDFDWRGQVVLCRVDINAPLDPETGALRDITRLKGCSPTVKELAEEAVVKLDTDGFERAMQEQRERSKKEWSSGPVVKMPASSSKLIVW